MDVQSKENLFLENQNLVYFTINKYLKDYREDEDLVQEGFIGLWKASLTWNSSRSKFSTYAVTCILNQIGMELRNRKRQHLNSEISLSTPINEEDEDLTLGDVVSDTRDYFEEADCSAMLSRLLKDVSEKDRYIILLLASGYSQKDVAEMLKCTRANISRIKRRFVTKFQNKI